MFLCILPALVIPFAIALELLLVRLLQLSPTNRWWVLAAAGASVACCLILSAAIIGVVTNEEDSDAGGTIRIATVLQATEHGSQPPEYGGGYDMQLRVPGCNEPVLLVDARPPDQQISDSPEVGRPMAVLVSGRRCDADHVRPWAWPPRSMYRIILIMSGLSFVEGGFFVVALLALRTRSAGRHS